MTASIDGLDRNLQYMLNDPLMRDNGPAGIAHKAKVQTLSGYVRGTKQFLAAYPKAAALFQRRMDQSNMGAGFDEIDLGLNDTSGGNVNFSTMGSYGVGGGFGGGFSTGGMGSGG